MSTRHAILAFSLRTARRLAIVSLLLLAIAALAWVARDELLGSDWQARYAARIASELSYTLEAGPAPEPLPAAGGPYDERLGYRQIPDFVARLGERGFSVERQARPSARMLRLSEMGLYPVYREKDRAGLALLGCSGDGLHASRHPERTYGNFESIPRLLVDSLLFIEDRSLLDATYPKRNPAVEWDRFAKAVVDQLVQEFDPAHDAAGGSTLATQIEKYRHSPEGRTVSHTEKLRQMAVATLRAYRNGEDTRGARHDIVVAYMNTVPLAAKPGFGEVNGFGDGLWAWYGRDFDEVNQLLAGPVPAGELFRKAEAYKQALSLMIAQRRPSYYLAGAGQGALARQTDSYLRLLGQAGIIPPALRDAALASTLQPREAPVAPPAPSFVTRKAINALRLHLSSLLGVPRFYDLDRIDLTATSTLDRSAQQGVSRVLRELGDPARAKAAGLYGHHMFKDGDDPGQVVFSFTLFERGEGANLLRVQTDNLDQPLDINEGIRLDLGSTAKLRTLVTYLEIIADLHRTYASMPGDALARTAREKHDPLTRWALAYLAGGEDSSLRAMLEAAMARTYPASPAESFYTGGGVHRFNNFSREEDERRYTVREALWRSVNLVFIRMMRDVERYYLYRDPNGGASLLEDADDPRRGWYLARFADREGQTFIAGFYRKYRGKTPEEAQALLLQGGRATARRVATALRSIDPEADLASFSAAMRTHLADSEKLDDEALAAYYTRYGPDKFNLPDRGYLAGIHPLELWVVGFLRAHPGATLGQALEASLDQRLAVYDWLFRTRHKNAQDVRIRSLLEVVAFLEIGKSWRRLGYPFEALTPSYATAIGSSGDRPAALAELMGIIVNGGVRQPTARMSTLHFAAGTPFETVMVRTPRPGERVLPAEVAEVVREALAGVVEEGTARRLKGAFADPDGRLVVAGGKTGTGDHRHEVFGRDGSLVSSRVVSRSATFVFFLGDRFYGTITAYVRGAEAERYSFTSALATQLLKALAPTLAPLLREGAPEHPAACAGPERPTP
jgi:membrane peptidoglycan carboxypeptidase